MKNSEKVEQIRNKISAIRGEIQDLQEDKTWEGYLNPSVGGLTCVLGSLWNAMDAIEKSENKWGN